MGRDPRASVSSPRSGLPSPLTAHRSPREVSEDHVLSNDVATRTGSSPDARDRNGGSYPSSAPCSGSVSPRRPRSAMLVQTEDAQEPPLAPGHLVCQPWRGCPCQAHARPPLAPLRMGLRSWPFLLAMLASGVNILTRVSP